MVNNEKEEVQNWGSS